MTKQSRFGRFVSISIVGLVAATTLAACGTQPDTKWIRNSSEGLFTKIPAEWKTYRIDPYAVDTVRLKPTKRTPPRWELLFDSTPNVKKAKARQNLESDLPRRLVGELSVQSLPLPNRFGQFGLRERLSLSAMRRFATFEFADSPPVDPESTDEENVEANTGTNEITAIEELFDPVDQFTEQGNPSIELLINEEYPADRKFPGAPQMRGNRIRFNWEVYDDRWVTIDQTILHDPKTTKIYRLVLKCEASCFKKNAKLASEISNSFTLKK
jgi:hypothetical protein